MSRIHLDPNANREALAHLNNSDRDRKLMFLAAMYRSQKLAERLGGTGITGYKVGSTAVLVTTKNNSISTRLTDVIHTGNDESAWEPQELISSTEQALGIPLSQTETLPIDPDNIITQIRQVHSRGELRLRFQGPLAALLVPVIIPNHEALTGVIRPLREALERVPPYRHDPRFHIRLRQGYDTLKEELDRAQSEMRTVANA